MPKIRLTAEQAKEQDALRVRIRLYNMSNRRAANALGIDDSRVSRFLNGATLPPPIAHTLKTFLDECPEMQRYEQDVKALQ